ncbi:hypothetical protein [Desulfovibrio sp. UCD-KL4C]|uniref:hypothetical protein n=1 Tax=Desulfovibrio sp. UCD-KL4C TaxID=2578120 RepID=UPI0025BE2FCF|nr:hypothetical protein [Desulfovibrio sp. UCD-KL4C]
MSISGVGSSMDSGGTAEMIAQLREAQANKSNGENDTVADALLSDQQGGSVKIGDEKDSSQEGLIESLKSNQEQNGMMGELAVSMQSGESSTKASTNVDESTSSNEEETFDAYDLNEDGVVTGDELLQAFEEGDESLANVVGRSKESEKNDGKSALTQKATRAYQAQSDVTGKNPLGVIA